MVWGACALPVWGTVSQPARLFVQPEPAGGSGEAQVVGFEGDGAQGQPGFTCVQQRHTYLRPRPGAEFGANPHISDEMLDYARTEPDLTLLGAK